MGDAKDATEHGLDGSAQDAASARLTPPVDDVMDLLAEHVPLALLADLAAPSDEVSTQILESEGLPDEAWWEVPDPAATAQDAPVAPQAPDQGGVESNIA